MTSPKFYIQIPKTIHYCVLNFPSVISTSLPSGPINFPWKVPLIAFPLVELMAVRSSIDEMVTVKGVPVFLTSYIVVPLIIPAPFLEFPLMVNVPVDSTLSMIIEMMPVGVLPQIFASLLAGTYNIIMPGYAASNKTPSTLQLKYHPLAIGASAVAVSKVVIAASKALRLALSDVLL